MKILSHLFSWVFLPLFMPTYGILISLFVPAYSSDVEMSSLYFAPLESKWALFTIFFLFSVVAPGVSFILLHRFKVISTIDIERQRERSLPLIIMLVYSLVLFFLLVYKAGAGTLPRYFYALPLSGVAVTSIFLVINRWIKISLHGAGAGILVGFLAVFTRAQDHFSLWWLIAALLAAGLTMASRLYLRKHTPLEIYAGFTLALLLTAGIHQYLS
jgi:membrane-associated phospholipid phosphatase